MKDWIPLSKELPPPYENVAVLTEGGMMCITYRYSNSGDHSYDFVNVNHVTHWMPIENGSVEFVSRTNRQWLQSFTDAQLSLFMTVGIPCHNIFYDYDVLLSLEMFHTPKELREWLSQSQQYTYGYKNEVYEEKELSL